VQCGFTVPPSEFVIAILTLLDVAPSQLSSVAWCHINSFQHFFRSYDLFKNLSPCEATIDLFLEYYEFVKSGSWITVKRREGGVFQGVNKVSEWNGGFYILVLRAEDKPWMDRIWHDWKVKNIILPERRLLNHDETALRLKIEELQAGLSSSLRELWSYFSSCRPSDWL
jgi:hypothetical protein